MKKTEKLADANRRKRNQLLQYLYQMATQKQVRRCAGAEGSRVFDLLKAFICL